MLRPCNECGAEISSRTKNCPQCGAKKPFQSDFQRGASKTAGCLFWIGVAGLALMVLMVTC